jgi:copper transport protein
MRNSLLRVGVSVVTDPVLQWVLTGTFVLTGAYALVRVFTDRTRLQIVGNILHLLISVLAITGVLSNLSPSAHDHHGPSSTVSDPVSYEFSGEAQGLRVSGILSPTLPGSNEVTFTLAYEGELLAIEDVLVRASLPAQDMGPFEVVPEFDADAGHYRAALDLPVRGEWRMQVLARVSAFAQPIVTIPVTIR